MDSELGASELGTQEYWDDHYKEEIQLYKSHGDVGDVWFGEDIVDRIISWMNKNITNKSAKIVDLGCGNGMLSIELSKEQYFNLLGVDYSEAAIKLSKSIAKEQSCTGITFAVVDILAEDNPLLTNTEVMLDKGTYDAISLSTDAYINRNIYIKNIYKAMDHPDARFVITSCNWTREELCEQFKSHFEQVEVIPTPQFKFGGKVGNMVSSVVFKKKPILS